MRATTAVSRPALRYYGGKWNLAPWVISHFPPHTTYVEPCGGAASVLLQKPRCTLETYNDIDGLLVNFFRVLRERPNELIRYINLTPWAREEYELSRMPHPDSLEMARRFWVGCNMSINGVYNNISGWRNKKLPMSSGEASFFPDVFYLEEIARRLKCVQIENKPFEDVVNFYGTSDNLIYFDPPYIADTRQHKKQYRYEVDNQFHIDAFEMLRSTSGYVVVSGYACELYAKTYEASGWHRVDREATTNGKPRIESLWLNPRTVEALNMPVQGRLL